MKEFIFCNPTQIVFGKDAVQGLGAEMKRHGRRCLLVYGQSAIKKIGLYDTVLAQLRAASLDVIEHGGVKANPVLSHARTGIAKARAERADCVLAVGGGSVLDEAKAIAAGALYDGDVWDFYATEKKPAACLPLVTVLTVPATGSEMNGGTVVTNEDTKQKFGFIHPALYPKTSFLDPALTRSLSRAQIAYGAVDALSHLMEGYFTHDGGWTPIQDRWAEGLARSIVEATERILAGPDDDDARATYMWGATLAWNGMVSAGIGGFSFPNHAVAHPIGAVYDLAHGATLAMVIPYWMQQSIPLRAARIAQFGRQALGLAAGGADEHVAAVACEKWRDWFRRIGAPTTFAEANVTAPDRQELLRLTVDLTRVWGMSDLPPATIERILQQEL